MSNTRFWVGGYGPEKSAHGSGLAAFRDAVETGTNHEVEVEITWNIMDEGRPNTDLFDLVETGEMFFCYFSSSYLGGRVPELNVLETPYLFDSLKTAHRALDGALGAKLKEAIRTSTGFEALGFWDNGFRHMTNRLRPIHTPDDCRGLTVRMQPNEIHEELIRSWGATPIAVDLRSAIRMIRDGDVDAQENPLANTVAYGVEKVHNHVTMTGHLHGARGLFAHRETFESLSDDLRDVVLGAVDEAVSVQREAAADLELSLRARLEAEGLEFVDLSPAGLEAFVEESRPAIELARQSLPEDLFQLAGP